ncbi:MAG TPA: asparagine synthase-related protein [Pseudonocardiaceae bacterium]|nr:asparagine synthase-related protein [Pseudonocardiaceae bacterium]
MGGWLVLPDLPQAPRVVPGWRCVAAHPSGRPWLVGSLDHGELSLAAVGSLRVGVIGSCPFAPTRLAELVAGVGSVTELDALAAVLPGCWHLVACLDGAVRVQGSLSGLRRVFHTQVAGIPVAGDRADVLAKMAGAGIDEQTLAVRVACGPHVPPPVGERGFWRGVHAVTPDHYVRIDPDGRAGERRWWRPPAPRLPLRAGADRVRAALQTAVATRVGVPERVSADLSGGLDSTSLCFLAAQAGRGDLLSFRWAEAGTANDDAHFAKHAARALPQAEHVVLAQERMPATFADPGATGDREAPFLFTRTLARIRHNSEFLAARGARHHMAGHGGDELFHSPPAYLHSLLRRQPLTAIRHVRGYRALGRWSWAATVAGLVRGGDVGAWWHQQARHLGAGPLPRRSPDLGWGHPLRAPGWVTPAALEITRAVLRATGDTAQPLAGDRGQHLNVAILRIMGPHYRQLCRVYATAGLRLELPYFDDRVVEAALAVRAEERRTPWRYKPLLAEAMRPVLPEVIAARATKGELSEDARVGFRRHLPEILEVFADSALAAHGLIDPDMLRRELLAPQADNTVRHALEDLLGCETWLRATLSPPSQERTNAAAVAP